MMDLRVPEWGASACGRTIDEQRLVCLGFPYDHDLDQYTTPSVGVLDEVLAHDELCKVYPDGSVHCEGPDTTGLVAVDIRAGRDYACIKTPEHTITCWQLYWNYEPTDPQVQLHLETPLGDTKYDAFEVHGRYAASAKVCGVRQSDGGLDCYFGGSGPPAHFEIPIFDEPIEQVVVNIGHICTVSVSGSVTCFGADSPEPPLRP